MNRKEFAIFACALKTYFPKEPILPNEQALDLWYNQLKDLPYDIAQVALNKWVATNKWSPSIAEIRETCARMSQNMPVEWSEAWEKVLKAIRKYGMYQEQEALFSFDDLTREAVKRLGFKSICLSDNIAADRANFRMIYEQLAERQRKDAQLPPSLKRLMETETKKLEG